MMDARSWRFLNERFAARYIQAYDKLREKGWTTLEKATTERQFRTARDILDRLNDGQKGVLLADDVGLGKTTVAALCALVVAGKQGRVRVLAPNAMMARRWWQEIRIHAGALAASAPHLDLQSLQRTLGTNRPKLGKGQIQVSTHTKSKNLWCDLLIVDEAHRARSEQSRLAQQIQRHGKDIGHVVVLTATPFSIDPRDLARQLTRVGAGASVLKPMNAFAKQLDALWKGSIAGDPGQIARDLADRARAAVDAIRPYVIRHSVRDLPAREKSKFGEFRNTSPREEVGSRMLEAMLRADRALLVGLQTGAWSKKRRNDPRYHVGRDMLLSDLAELKRKLEDTSLGEAAHGVVHAKKALRLLRDVEVHPKVAATAAQVDAIVGANEKVLVFCDHHVPAGELALVLSGRLRREVESGCPPADTWKQAWDAIIPRPGEDAPRDAPPMREAFIAWLCSEGIRTQIAGWLGSSLAKTTGAAELKSLLRKSKARRHPRCESISRHAIELHGALTTKSKSTQTRLLAADASALPGASMTRMCAVAQLPVHAIDASVFFHNEPDTVLEIFNSPFGPDVLVTTDKLSEGVDLHRFCRYLIHHELDPSPVRTVQRNGRLRRVGSWAARTGEDIVVSYPALAGTRDERVVEIMQMRLEQFDLLLGGIGQDIDAVESVGSDGHTLRILGEARKQMAGKLKLTSKVVTPKRARRASDSAAA